jgi:nitrite reductase/ring-hydroxylating ferredoxin subunit/uncharacterized membrane protein
MSWFPDALSRQSWLDTYGEQLQHLTTGSFTALGPQARRIRNLLHGTWLGHPLHPVLTDVAIGGWTLVVAFDFLDEATEHEDLATGADLALKLGILGALGSAVTGANDWQHTDGRSRRLGVAHALLNAATTALFTASLVARLRGSRGAGRWLARLGIGVCTAAAHVGGHLVYGEQVGVNHAAGLSAPEDFTPVLPNGELADNAPHLAEVAGTRVVLVRSGGRIYALAEVCSHLGGPLAEGQIVGNGIVCPWHGSRFALTDGRVLDGPATFSAPCFETRVLDGMIEIRTRSDV